ncbi:MAG: MFS transporter [Actinomycetota bacterium]
MARAQTPPSARRTTGLGGNFYKLWVASAVSNFGDGVRLTALPLLAATLTRDPGLVAGVSFASGAPWLLFALTAGALVDRFDRRRTMWIMQVWRMVLMVALSLAIVAGLGTVPLLATLYLASFLLGVGEVMFDNAAQAIMPGVVRKDQLQVANGRLYAVEEVTNRFAGPPFGSFLFVASAALPFIFDAVSFGIGALLIFAMAGSYAPPRGVSASPTKIRHEIAEGIRWLWGHRVLRTLAMMTGVSNLVSNATHSIFVLFALELLGLSEWGYGVLIAVSSVGGLIGSLLGARLARLFGDGRSLYVIVLVMAAGDLAIGVTSSALVVAVAMSTFGLGAMWWNVIAVALRQSVVPDRLLGRVNSVYRLLAWGTIPLGAAVGGLLGELFGLRAAYFFSAAVLVVLALAVTPVISNRSLAEARARSD